MHLRLGASAEMAAMASTPASMCEALAAKGRPGGDRLAMVVVWHAIAAAVESVQAVAVRTDRPCCRPKPRVQYCSCGACRRRNSTRQWDWQAEDGGGPCCRLRVRLRAGVKCGHTLPAALHLEVAAGERE